MSHDINKSIRKGEQDAKTQERAKKRGAAAGRGGRSKSGFSRSAGRAAVGKMQIRGRGIAAEVWKNGKSFKNRIDYALNKEKGAELIYANSDLRSMRAAAKLRPDIREPVGHISMSLSPTSGKRTKEEWAELVETARRALGLDDSFPLIVARHNDTDHDHIHLVFSRISITGKCHDQANLGLKCAAVERILEDKHSLKLTPPSEFKSHNNKLTKNEIEMSTRTHQRPPRLLITDALKIAVQGKPTVQQFVERLNAAGVGVKANVASTGRMNGFSFVYNGVAFSASQIGKQYGWKQLEGAINYDQARGDTQFLAQLDGNPGRASTDVATATATIDALDRAVKQVSPATPDATANRRNDQAPTDRASALPARRQPSSNAGTEETTTATAQPAIRGVEQSGIDVVHSNQYRRSHFADPDLPVNPPLTTKGEKHDHDQQTNNSTNASSGSATRRRTSWRTSPANLSALQRQKAATAGGLRTLSSLTVVPNAPRGEMLLQRNAPVDMDNLRANPGPELRRPGAATVKPKSIRSAVPTGFEKVAPLNIDLAGFAAGISNRIQISRRNSGHLVLAGMFDNQNRMLAINTNSGFAITDTRNITNEQIASLLFDPELTSPVTLSGTPDFCERVEKIALANGLQVKHEYQVTEAERRAAEARWEERQREESKSGQSNLPTFSPK